VSIEPSASAAITEARGRPRQEGRHPYRGDAGQRADGVPFADLGIHSRGRDETSISAHTRTSWPRICTSLVRSNSSVTTLFSGRDYILGGCDFNFCPHLDPEDYLSKAIRGGIARKYLSNPFLLRGIIFRPLLGIIWCN
jgi:hypothetical protein